MAGKHPHEHLGLPLVVRSPKRMKAQSRTPHPEYSENLRDRPAHGKKLRDQADARTESWREFIAQREAEGLPELPPGIPLLLRIRDGEDVDFFRSAFSFEVVAELEGGFALVASGDNDLTTLRAKLDAFVASAEGPKTVAKLYELVPDETTEGRLNRILSPHLLNDWPNFANDMDYLVQASISFGGALVVPKLEAQKAAETDEAYAKHLERHFEKYADEVNPPTPRSQRPAQTDAEYSDSLAKHDEKSREYFRRLDELKDERMEEVEDRLSLYGAKIESSFIDEIDSFTFLVRLSGKALRDFVLTYKYLFRVSEPETADISTSTGEGGDSATPVFLPPPIGAPKIAILDSGIQEAHPYLAPAIKASDSICLAANLRPHEVGDLFGHGTRVAGAALFPEGVPDESRQLPFRLVNIKVLDNKGLIADSQLNEVKTAGQYIRDSVAHANALNPPARILNHSVANSTQGFHGPHMSPWAASIDRISYQSDTLIIQAAGNLWSNRPTTPDRCVTSILASGKQYPDYLLEDSSRISDPGQALHALTVGSVCFSEFESQFHKSFGSEYHPSAFTTTGPGMWGTVKPDVVVPSGDFARDLSEPPSVVVREEAAFRLPRSTINGGPLIAADDVGTSFAAPIVAHLAARIEAEYPDLSMQHVRALIGLSARWPDWCQKEKSPQGRYEVLRQIGFGIPDFERAVRSADSSVTFVSPQLESIKMREAHIYQIPIPEEIREIAWNRGIRIEVSLAYTALPRQTRRQRRGYLSTWIDWTCIKMQGESVAEFIEQVLNLASDDEGMQSGVDADEFPWTVRERSSWGQVANVSRSSGTLQKDWCIVKGIDLPNDLCFAVIGHVGWDKTGTFQAKYALTVSIECDDETVELYAPLQLAVESMRIQV